jgi:hypothetical protein
VGALHALGESQHIERGVHGEGQDVGHAAGLSLGKKDATS